jgi:hypothetical protein
MHKKFDPQKIADILSRDSIVVIEIEESSRLFRESAEELDAKAECWKLYSKAKNIYVLEYNILCWHEADDNTSEHEHFRTMVVFDFDGDRHAAMTWKLRMTDEQLQ